MAAPDTAEEIRDVNTRYHDGAADSYDAKWGIDYGDICQTQVLMKAEKAFGKPVPHFENVLEIGAGTGYLSLNLMLAGKIDKLTATDISPGMLEALRANAKALKLSSRVKTKAVDAETLPFKDNQFDLVMGHAILHHIPDLDQAFSEFHRVLKPGGKVFFAGEPSRIGDQLAQYPKRFATKVAPVWRAAVRAKPAPPHGDAPEDQFHGLEHMVDVHAFVPKDLEAHAKAGGFGEVDVLGEELLANWFGWTNRALEATADQWTIPWAWRQYAYRGYLAFQQVDRRLLEGRLPTSIFYNLMVVATKEG
jgi:ubiquinone/menaquinone biosynthesis C-methylase UbiE